MNRKFQNSSEFQSPEELRAKEWSRLERKIRERALTLWRRKGKRRLDVLSAWRLAERQVLTKNRASTKNRRNASVLRSGRKQILQRR